MNESMARLAGSGNPSSPTKRITRATSQASDLPENLNPFQTQSRIRRSGPGAPSIQPTIEEQDNYESPPADTRERQLRSNLGDSAKDHTDDHTEEEEEEEDLIQGHTRLQQAGSETPAAWSKDKGKGPEPKMRARLADPFTTAGSTSQVAPPKASY
jgi:hypothetical protein